MSVQTICNESVPNCPLCRRVGALLYERVEDRLHRVPGRWNFLRCVHCSLIWLDPRPITADIPKCYPDEYFTHKLPGSVSLGSSDFKRGLRLAALRKHLDYRHLDPQTWLLSTLGTAIMCIPSLRAKIKMGLGPMLFSHRRNGRLLDIGCGNGGYLATMKELGWGVAGVEMDARAAEIARSRFGIFVYTGSINDAPFEEASFDAVTMSHVIEHVPEPVDFMRAAARFLKAGGQLVIVTPNGQSLGSRAFKKHWYALDPPRHFVIFTPHSLKMSLVKTRLFREVKTSTLARQSKKICRKYILVQKTGCFRHHFERALAKAWRTRTTALLFELLEQLGNPIFKWGEEVECVAIKA